MLKNKATKIVVSLAGLLCMGSLFCGCGNTIGMATSTNSYNNEKVLAKDSSSYNYWEKEGTADETSADINFFFSGNDVIWKIDSEKDTDLQCSYDINISSGKFKIIEITDDKNIVTLWENTDSSENSGNFPIHLSTGTSRIKIVGKKAQGTATLSLADNSDVQVEAVSYSK